MRIIRIIRSIRVTTRVIRHRKGHKDHKGYRGYKGYMQTSIDVLWLSIDAFQCTCSVEQIWLEMNIRIISVIRVIKITGTPGQMSTISPTPRPNEYNFALTQAK